jgi:hypothetical protein
MDYLDGSNVYFSCNIYKVGILVQTEPVFVARRFRFSHIIFIFLYGLGRLTYFRIVALPSFPWASMISSFTRHVVEGVFRKSGIVHYFKMVDPVWFVFEFHVLYSGDL